MNGLMLKRLMLHCIMNGATQEGFYDGVQLLVYFMMDGGSIGKTDWLDFRGGEAK